MKRMKEAERLMIAIRVFLHLNGPATAIEISQFLISCPVNFRTPISSRKIAMLLRGKAGINVIKDKRINKYGVVT